MGYTPGFDFYLFMKCDVKCDIIYAGENDFHFKKSVFSLTCVVFTRVTPKPQCIMGESRELKPEVK